MESSMTAKQASIIAVTSFTVNSKPLSDFLIVKSL